MPFGAGRPRSSRRTSRRRRSPTSPASTRRSRSSRRSATTSQNPAKYQAIGAKIPKGVLLVGPPGTGKTLLARAVAGEAGRAVLLICGLGLRGDARRRRRGARPRPVRAGRSRRPGDRVHRRARRRGPPPRRRLGGGHDEREQTLNQLLVEMDGFEQRTASIVMGATNRPDILDPALLRPGRFDRQVVVDRPDVEAGGDPPGARRGKPLAADGRPRRDRRGATPGLHRRRAGERDQRGGAARGTPLQSSIPVAGVARLERRAATARPR